MFKDPNPDVPADARYKVLLPADRRSTSNCRGLLAVKSIDGLHWLPMSGGELITKPVTFYVKTFWLNFATSAVGSLHVKIQDGQGPPQPGYLLDDCQELFGDTLDCVGNWKTKDDLSVLTGHAVKVRFVLRDADLYLFQIHD